MEYALKKLNNKTTLQHINDVVNYLETQTQFVFKFTEEKLELTQKEDNKKINVDFADIKKVLTRQDVDDTKFLQLNYANGTKILITKSLVGFRPTQLVGFDLTKIPRVVTTVDLQSVRKAIEDMFDSEENYEIQTEIEILKKVYQSILFGAENVGFKMEAEKAWLTSIMLNHSAAVA